ncbi:hypothetical protein POM88_043587 [Heracleum sosnowskyi]|uniref:Uncharacterized protein n=2 Tax=Heracleum sosnowskyi TaxID=360622 RepID=A0AAD8H3M3_9APIA|nr:hypothetical protein POM88_043587 [Heracleum sosnowskyi]
MSLVNGLHMNAAGNHQCSYADNSTLQKNVILKSRKVLEDTIKDFGTHGFSECSKLADLGCSSGPTAFLSVTNIINSICALCQEKNLKAPNEFQVFMNDLPNNDSTHFLEGSHHFMQSLKMRKAMKILHFGITCMDEIFERSGA